TGRHLVAAVGASTELVASGVTDRSETSHAAVGGNMIGQVLPGACGLQIQGIMPGANRENVGHSPNAAGPQHCSPNPLLGRAFELLTARVCYQPCPRGGLESAKALIQRSRSPRHRRRNTSGPSRIRTWDQSVMSRQL